MNSEILKWQGKFYPANEFIVEDGKLYARVSTILKPFFNFTGIPEEVLQNKCKLGTNVHDYIHQEINGNFPLAFGQEIGYCQSFQKWRDALRTDATRFGSACQFAQQRTIDTTTLDALIAIHGRPDFINCFAFIPRR